MKKLLAVLMLAALAGHVSAQTPVLDDGREIPRRVSYDNEVGVRYGAHIGVGGASGLDMQYIALDYVRYNFYNIGFRTGFNYYVDNLGSGQYLSVPMQFTWRTGRMKNRNSKPDPHGYYYNGQFYPDADYGSPASALLELLPPIPSIIELHAGFTPGIFFGSRAAGSESDCEIIRRFACTADLGARLNLPIKRWRIFVDVTYRCYLTRNFLHMASGTYPGRSFVDIGGGVAYNF